MKSILFLLHREIFRARTIRSNVFGSRILHGSCYSACTSTGTLAAFLSTLQGKAKRQESTAGDNLLCLRCGQQSPNPVSRRDRGSGQMWNGACLHRSLLAMGQNHKSTVFEEAWSHKAGIQEAASALSFPPTDERNTQPQEVYAFKCCQMW